MKSLALTALLVSFSSTHLLCLLCKKKLTHVCETSVSREVRDDAILCEVEVPVEGSKDVCEVVYIAGDADETWDNDVNCVDKKSWCVTPITSRWWSS